MLKHEAPMRSINKTRLLIILFVYYNKSIEDCIRRSPRVIYLLDPRKEITMVRTTPNRRLVKQANH